MVALRDGWMCPFKLLLQRLPCALSEGTVTMPSVLEIARQYVHRM